MKSINVCKNWNALIRSSTFLRQLVATRDLVDSFIHFGHKRLDTRILTIVLRNLPKFTEEYRAAFIRGLPARLDDNDALRNIYIVFGVSCSWPHIELPRSCLESACLARLDTPMIFWDPPSKNSLLLSCFDFKTVVRPAMLSNSSGQFGRYFVPALFAQYIIPAFTGNRLLSEFEILLIRSIAPYCGSKLGLFFQNVLYAVYLIEGQVILQMPTIKRLHKLLTVELDFNWITLSTIHSDYRLYGIRFQQQMVSAAAVAMTAAMWGLEIDKVHKGLLIHGYQDNPSLNWESLKGNEPTVLNLIKTLFMGHEVTFEPSQIVEMNAYQVYSTRAFSRVWGSGLRIQYTPRTDERQTAFKRPAYEFVEEIDKTPPCKRIKIEEIDEVEAVEELSIASVHSSANNDGIEERNLEIDLGTYWKDDTWWTEMADDSDSF